MDIVVLVTQVPDSRSERTLDPSDHTVRSWEQLTPGEFPTTGSTDR